MCPTEQWHSPNSWNYIQIENISYFYRMKINAKGNLEGACTKGTPLNLRLRTCSLMGAWPWSIYLQLTAHLCAVTNMTEYIVECDVHNESKNKQIHEIILNYEKSLRSRIVTVKIIMVLELHVDWLDILSYKHDTYCFTNYLYHWSHQHYPWGNSFIVKSGQLVLVHAYVVHTV